MIVKRVLMTGLHSTGKSTFIAALRHFVGENETQTSLKLDTLTSTEDKYINLLATSWLECEDLPRTNLSNPSGEGVMMHLKRSDNNEPIILDIPDFNGETFNLQFTRRKWEEVYKNRAIEADGVVLFVNPMDENNMPKLLYIANEYARIFGETASSESESKTAFLSENVPNQVKLVDILQFFQLYKKNRIPLRLALIISAWDRVEEVMGKDVTPKNWLRQGMPLLYQFLECNFKSFNVEFFGISAQGGDYEDEASKEKLLKKTPIERIIVKTDQDKTNDIAQPILWVTS